MKKITQAQKKEFLHPPDNKTIVTFGYNDSFIIASNHAAQLLEILATAEKYVEDYHEPQQIIPLPKDFYSFKPMNQESYLDIKISQLLEIPTTKDTE